MCTVPLAEMARRLEGWGGEVFDKLPTRFYRIKIYRPDLNSKVDIITDIRQFGHTNVLPTSAITPHPQSEITIKQKKKGPTISHVTDESHLKY